MLCDTVVRRQVLSLSLEEIVLRLRHLAGKSAMLLLHDIDDPELWDMAQLLDTLAASVARGQAPTAASRSAHSSHSCSPRSASSCRDSGSRDECDPSQAGAAAGSSVGGRGAMRAVPGPSVGAAADAADSGPASYGEALMLPSSSPGMHPAVEYTLLVGRKAPSCSKSCKESQAACCSSSICKQQLRAAVLACLQVMTLMLWDEQR